MQTSPAGMDAAAGVLQRSPALLGRRRCVCSAPPHPLGCGHPRSWSGSGISALSQTRQRSKSRAAVRGTSVGHPSSAGRCPFKPCERVCSAFAWKHSTGICAKRFWVVLKFWEAFSCGNGRSRSTETPAQPTTLLPTRGGSPQKPSWSLSVFFRCFKRCFRRPPCRSAVLVSSPQHFTEGDSSFCICVAASCFARWVANICSFCSANPLPRYGHTK